MDKAEKGFFRGREELFLLEDEDEEEDDDEEDDEEDDDEENLFGRSWSENCDCEPRFLKIFSVSLGLCPIIIKIP